MMSRAGSSIAHLSTRSFVMSNRRSDVITGTAEATVASCHMCGPLISSYSAWLTASAFLFATTDPIPNLRASCSGRRDRCK